MPNEWRRTEDELPPEDALLAVVDVAGTVSLATFSRWDGTNNFTVFGPQCRGRIVWWCAITPPLPPPPEES